MCVNAFSKLLNNTQMLIMNSTRVLTECKILKSGFFGIIEASVQVFLFQLEWKQTYFPSVFKNSRARLDNLPTYSRIYLNLEDKMENQLK